MNTVHILPTDVPHIIAATFPGYTGKKVQVVAAESVVIDSLNWTGGTRSRFAACTLDGKRTGDSSVGNMAAPWNNPVEGKSIAVPQGFALVEHVIFCGKDLGLRIHVNPADMPKYLPAGDSELTAEEKIILSLISGLISSYRREEAARKGINAGQYDSLVETLKGKGLLSKNGALSLKGKNIAATLPRI